jgi:PAS domain S-box-containing protein
MIESELDQQTQVLAEFSNNLKQLHRLSVSRFDSLDALFADYIQTGCDIFGFAAGAVGRIQGETYTFLAVQSTFESLVPGLAANLQDTYCGKVANRRATVTFHQVGQIEEMQCHPLYRSLRLESYLGTPIWVDGELFGTLCFFSTEVRSQGFANHEQEIIELMAQSIGNYIYHQQSRAELEALFQAITDVVVVRDRQGRCLKVASTSPNLVKPVEAMLGKTLHETFPAETADLLLEGIQTCLDARQIVDIEYGLPAPKQDVWLSARISPLADDVVILVARDISDRKRLELALTRSQAKLTNVLNSAHAAIASVRVLPDQTWSVEYRSVGYETIFGFPLERFAADPEFWASQVVPEDLQAYYAKLSADIPVNRSGIVEYRFHHADGTVHWISESYTPHWHEETSSWIVTTVDTDISDRKQVEAALTRQQEFLRSVIDTAPNLIFAKDWNARFVLANQAVAEIYGTTVENLIGKNDADFNPNLTEVEHFFQDDRAVIRSQQPRLIEELVTAATGVTHWFQTIKKPIMAIDGKSQLVLGIATDITERKQMEQALRLIVDGIATKTGGEFFHSLVQHLAEVLNVRYALVSELVQPDKTCAQTLAFWSRNEFIQNFAYELAGTPCGQVLAGEIVYYQNSIQSHFLDDPYLVDLEAESYFGIPLNDSSGNIIGHLAVMDSKPLPTRQLSEQILRIFAARAGAELERKQSEDALSELLSQTRQQSLELEKARDAAEAANYAKSEFLANMSHELRTPLNVILGFTQVIARTPSLSEPVRDYLATINRSGEHLLDMINDVLEMSKIEAGKLSFNPTDFDLQDLLINLENMFRLRAQSKGLQLILETAPDTPQYIQTDEGKLRQVLVNLLGNAIKFTTTGTIALRVSVDHQVASQVKLSGLNQKLGSETVALCFEVSDTGMGIDPKELPLMFEPFVQSRSRVHQVEGTGLGLPISRKFVQLMQGSIELFSELGVGTTVNIQIPVQRVAQISPRLSTSRHSIINLAPGQPVYRILVVEDHLESRRLLVTLLRSQGFEVQEAADGKTAIELWQSWQPHLIWMDMHLPIVDGYEATRQIRAMESQQDNSTIIIALTASAFEEDRTNVLASGCNDFVRKPFREDLLLGKIQDYLGVQFVSVDPESDAKIQPSEGLSDLQLIQTELQKVMPAEWLNQCYQAANLGSDQRLMQLIAQIPETHAAIAMTLAELVNDFCFDQLLSLTQLSET